MILQLCIKEHVIILALKENIFPNVLKDVDFQFGGLFLILFFFPPNTWAQDYCKGDESASDTIDE